MSNKIIAIANQKGGVGKTTSTVNIARALIDEGASVLMIDCDPQSSLSIVYGVDPLKLRELEHAGKTLYYGLVKDTPLAELIIEGSPALIPTSIRLANAETELTSPFGAATVLRDRLVPLRDRYDVILLDCPPQLSTLTINALVAADGVVIPCKTDYLSIMGISLLLQTIEDTKRRANPRLRTIGILPTIFNARALHDSEALQELKNSVAAARIEVFDPVNRSTNFDKANLESSTTLQLFPHTPGVEQYRLVANRILHHDA